MPVGAWFGADALDTDERRVQVMLMVKNAWLWHAKSFSDLIFLLDADEVPVASRAPGAGESAARVIRDEIGRLLGADVPRMCFTRLHGSPA